MEAYLAKMKKRGKPRYEERPIEEKTSLHSKFFVLSHYFIMENLNNQFVFVFNS